MYTPVVRRSALLALLTILVINLVGCATPNDSNSIDTDTPTSQSNSREVETKPLTPLEEFSNSRPDLLREISDLYLYQLDLSDDSIREKRIAEIESDSEFKRISVSLDLAIDRGLFDDLYGANSSVNAPELFCDSVRDETIGSILGIFRRDLGSGGEPSEGFEISILWNVYDKFEDNFGGYEYKLVRKYGKDRVGISVGNWKKIVFDEFFKTEAKPLALSDLFRPTKNSYPRGRCLWEP